MIYTIPWFFEKGDEYNTDQFEQAMKMCIAWTFRCTQEKYETGVKPLLGKYSKKILSKCLSGDPAWLDIEKIEASW